MNESIVGYFEDFSDADDAVAALTTAGFQSDEISVITQDSSGKSSIRTASETSAAVEDDEPIGSATGAMVGGLTGLLVGVGALLIPGIGPVLAAGPVAAALGAGVGAVSGAVTAPILDALVGAGVPADRAQAYLDGIGRGGVLIALSCDSTRAEEARTILDESGALDIEEATTDEDETSKVVTPRI